MEIKVSFHYNGTFFSKNEKILYREGSVYITDVVDSDELSKFELESFLKEGVGIENVKEFWFSESGKCVGDGFQCIEADSDINALVASVKEDMVARVYVVMEGEVSPSTVMAGDGLNLRRSPRKHHTLNCPEPVIRTNSSGAPNPISTFSSAPRPTQASTSTENPFSNAIPTQASTSRTETAVCGKEMFVGDGGSRTQAEDEINEEEGSEQSTNSVDGIRFDDSAEEVDDLFYEFDDTVDKQLVEEVTRAFAFDDCDANLPHPVSDVEAESYGLKTPEASDGDGKRKRYPEFNHRIDFKAPIKLVEGMLFASNEIFRKAISQCSIERGGDFYFLHNDSKKVSVMCKMKCDCPWKHSRRVCGSRNCVTLRCRFRAFARRTCGDGTFQLKSMIGEHTCGKQHLNARVTSKFLAEKYLENYRDDPNLKLTAFQNTVLRDIGVKISYPQAMRTRMRAFLMLQGDAKKQYAAVCDYAETLMKWNPGSSAFVKCHGPVERPIFQRFYVCLEACKRGFLLGCRPIVGLDGCHLKGAYTGQILSAVAKDGNENIFPIAFAVVESECKETW